jgi:DNA-binding winged helix-turn-helix (wHTH) protein
MTLAIRSSDVDGKEVGKHESAWQFGAFTLLPTQHVLLEEDAPVRVGGRALDLLIVLVEAAGKIVGRDELMASVWKKVVVDEGSLRVHVAALRRVLRDDGDARRYIANVPGRGYSFVGDVSPSAPDGVADTLSRPDLISDEPQHGLHNPVRAEPFDGAQESLVEAPA